MSEIWTQGTQMFVSGMDTEGQLVLHEVGGVKGFTPPTPTKNEIEITTLKDKAKRFMNGLIDGGEGTITLNYLEEDEGQKFLDDMYKSDGVIDVVVGLNNGFGIVPEKTEDGYELPETRGWYIFSGPVKQFAIELGEDSAVGASAIVKSSGEAKLIRKK